MALIGPLAWQPLYAAEAALEKAKRQKKKKKKNSAWHTGQDDKTPNEAKYHCVPGTVSPGFTTPSKHHIGDTAHHTAPGRLFGERLMLPRTLFFFNFYF